MSSRKSQLNLVAFSVNPGGGAASHLCNLVSHGIKVENLLVDGKCIAESFPYNQLSGKKWSVSAELNQSATPNTKPMQTNLSVSVYTVGGTNYLGDLDSFDLSLTNNIQEGAGLADVWDYPNAVDRDFSISAAHLVPSATTLEPLMEIISDGNEAAQAVTLVFTGGLAAFELPVIIESVGFDQARGQLNRVPITFKPRGTPTSTPNATSTILGRAYGTATCGLWIDTGAGQFGLTGAYLNALITSCQIRVARRAIITNSFEFLGQGASTWGASS